MDEVKEGATATALEKALAEIKAASKSGRGNLVLDGGFEPGRTRRVDIGAFQLATIMRMGLSHLAYVDVATFDFGEEIEAAVAEAGLEGTAAAACAMHCKEALRPGLQDGQMVAFQAVVVVDGVAHVATMEHETYGLFGVALAEVLEEAAATMAATLRTAEAAGLRAHAEALLADPRWDAPKTSKSKREFLARELFPDLEPKAVSTTVEEAENIAFYKALAAKAAKDPGEGPGAAAPEA